MTDMASALLMLTGIGLLLLIYWWVQPTNESGNE